jgi:hypothetical protein
MSRPAVIRMTAAPNGRSPVVGRRRAHAPPMPSDHLSAHARRFLAQDVTSVMQLELILVLHRDPSARWTPDELARELRASEVWVAEQLSLLTTATVVRTDDDGTTHRLDPEGAHAAGLEEIAASYPQRRTSIINLIFASAPR